MDYADFLIAKIPRAEVCGFEPPSPPHPSLFPHQVDIAKWMVRGGQRANFAAFGLGKTRTHIQVALWVLEHADKSALRPPSRYLIVCPLGVRHVFTREDGPAMGVEIAFCRTDAEVDASPARIIVTNYDSVVDGKLTIDARFAGAGLDEASCLRSFGSKTYQSLLGILKRVRYRFVFTATPSPNRHKELIHYAGVLGVMDTGQALTRFFKRDSKKAGNLKLYPHMEEKFWLWLSTWACFIQRPSDLGYSDEGYELPPIKIHWHVVPVDHHKAWQQVDSYGQAQLIADQSSGLKEVAGIKRDTIPGRIACAMRIMAGEWSLNSDPDPTTPSLHNSNSPVVPDPQLPLAPRDRHWLLWHELESERHLIEKMIPDARTAYGSQDLDEREDLIVGFSNGDYRILATKPSIAGSGCNFQRKCADAIFLGSTYKFNDLIQAVHRIQRFQQTRPVTIHFIYSESEGPVIQSLKTKWKQHNELVARMSALLRKHRLSMDSMKLTRSLGTKRVEVSGDRFRAIHNDCVQELETMADNSVDCSITSIPFGNQYEYSEKLEDFGHNLDNGGFFRQMDYMLPHWLRVMKPGRVAAIHVKDRIRFANVTGKSRPTVDRFSDKTADAFEKHGWCFFGRITIETDVVRENNGTYRLGYTKNCEDSTTTGVGMPEYVLLFYKLPTDLSDGFADERVTKSKDEYSLARWQIDADEFWKSDGNRLMDPDFLLHLPYDQIGRLWRDHATKFGYNYDEHIRIGSALEKKGKLPKEYSLFPPISRHPEIWTDISRIDVLNSEQWKNGEENHVCPLQKDIVRRLIHRFTNPNEWVLDPFAGIFTTPFIAIKEGRCGIGIELNDRYWKYGVGYCEQAEAERSVPDLMDWAKSHHAEPV